MCMTKNKSRKKKTTQNFSVHHNHEDRMSGIYVKQCLNCQFNWERLKDTEAILIEQDLAN